MLYLLGCLGSQNEATRSYGHNREVTLVAAIALAAVEPVAAETLKADSILCETEASIALLAEPDFAKLSGSEAMKRIAHSAEFWKTAAQFNALLASTERSVIRARDATQKKKMLKRRRAPK